VAYVTAAPEGTRLPPERSFAERLGVSRSTLRAAIARLELLGLVEVRHGSGIVVRRPDLARQLGLLLTAAVTGADLAAQALELRALIEPSLAALAAKRRRQPPADGDEAAFHRSLAEASGNHLAGALVAALVGLGTEPALPAPLHSAQHAAIAAAVEVGDVYAARDAMALHLRSLRRAAAGR
jgi:DNA-binding FadR family transcriptional regulator